MKSEILLDNLDNRELVHPYPVLKINKERCCVILFSHHGVGMVISNTGTKTHPYPYPYPIGYTSRTWLESDFDHFYGKIQLSND